ncbi:hypothetical protein GCM10010388_32840 [Streptomyces mauvecolor]
MVRADIDPARGAGNCATGHVRPAAEAEFQGSGAAALGGFVAWAWPAAYSLGPRLVDPQPRQLKQSHKPRPGIPHPDAAPGPPGREP